MKKATLLSESVVYENPVINDKVLATLEKGIYVDYTREWNKNGEIWLEVLFNNNTKGYIISKNSFKWIKGKVRDSVSFYPDLLKNEEKKYEILQSGEVIYIILPLDKDQENNSIATVLDSKERKGTLKEKYIRHKGLANIITVLSALAALAFTIVAVIQAYTIMIKGGTILIGGLVIFGCLFLWAVIFKILNSGLSSLYQNIYKFIIRF